MPRFSANLTFLFTEVPFLDRFKAAAAAGFVAVEFMFPYDHRASDLASQLRVSGLVLDLFNLPVGDFAAGDRGLAVSPRRRDEFEDGVNRALAYAAVLGTRKLNCLVGLSDPQLSWDQQYACLVENLRRAASQVERHGVMLLVEQLNPVETPGFFLDSLPLAERVLRDVGSPSVRLQFDAYHVQRTHGNVVTALRRVIDQVGHVQIADSPDRGEPGTGELAYGYILGELDQLGYTGRVGLEYRPTKPTPDSFEWVGIHGWRLDQ